MDDLHKATIYVTALWGNIDRVATTCVLVETGLYLQGWPHGQNREFVYDGMAIIFL